MKNPFSILSNNIVGPLFGFVSVIFLGCFVIFPILKTFLNLSHKAEVRYLVTTVQLSCLVGCSSTICLLNKIKREYRVTTFMHLSACIFLLCWPTQEYQHVLGERQISTGIALGRRALGHP